MNVAIIGCGYVGCGVARYWQQKMTFVVTATTTTPERVPTLQAVAQRVEIVKGNDPDLLHTVLKNQDVVLLSVGAKSADVYEETYLHTAQTLVSVLKQIPSVQQLIYTGSYAVYGDRNGAWVDEESLVAPANQNGQILSDTEQILLSASNEFLNVCILRLGGIYGPDRELVKIFGRFAGTTRPGNGKDTTNWIHLDDIIAAIEFARRRRLQGIYNLVNDDHFTTKELLERVCETHNLSKVIWDSSQESKRPYNVNVSNKKIKDAGYKLIHPQMMF
ncbi:SDR family oxidoreductase [Mastigocladopsis repens]|uniref:SDR family oxidoreductase n=1 Tax=Mastigocladopsis repens TaxID=221287 RepID=UPI000316C0E5|nr:SDR family oxidoreductase [Mastigocladopsis repens]